MLPPFDSDFLKERVPDHKVVAEGGVVCVVLPDFTLPAGLNVKHADLLLRLPAGYPDAAPDMWWFSPAVTRANGATFPATEAREFHLGRDWQRWSRHLQPGQWQPGRDSIESYLSLVWRELCRGSALAA